MVTWKNLKLSSTSDSGVWNNPSKGVHLISALYTRGCDGPGSLAGAFSLNRALLCVYTSGTQEVWGMCTETFYNAMS